MSWTTTPWPRAATTAPWLDLVAQCVAFNDWPGHTDYQVQTISPPTGTANGHVNDHAG